MACRGNKTVTTTTAQSCKSSGGGGGNSSVVIAGGGTSPKLHKQNNNKSTYPRVQQAHLLNPISGDCTGSTDTADLSANLHSGNLDEMAGDIRLVDGKKPRKLWTLRDRSTMSVHLLKANLAEDGCDVAQLDVAKKLLQDSDDSTCMESVQRQDSRLAIYWLIKSSEQGNEEATRLLRDCISSGRGITGQNILDVKTCISTPTNEKLTFKAARLLYLKLNNGEEFITTTQLAARIHEVKEKEKPPSSSSSPNDSYNETDDSIISGMGSRTVSVDGDFMEKVGLNTTFTYPHPKEFDAKQDEQSTQLEDDMCTKQSLSAEQLSSQGGVKLTIHDLLNAAGSFNSGNLPRPSITSKENELERHDWKISSRLNAFVAQILLLAAFSGTIKLTPCCIYIASWVSIWASYNVLIWKKRHSNFQDWSEAFKSVLVQGTWSDEKPESRLIIKYLLPYLFSLAGSLVVFTVFDGLQFLKAILGVLVMFAVFRGAMRSSIPSWRIMLIFGIANLPSALWKMSTYVDTLLDSNMSQQAMEWKDELAKQLEIDALVPSKESVILTLQLMLALSLVWRRRNNLMCEYLPEILFTFWFIEFSQISLQLNVEEAYVVCAGCIVLILTFLVLESKMKTWKASVVVILVILLAASGLCVSIKPNSLRKVLMCGESSSSEPSSFYDYIDNLNHVEWDEYNNNCHRKAWKFLSPAETQLKCFMKYGSTPSAVRWTGRLSLVKVRDIQVINDSVQDATFDINVNILTNDGSEGTSWQSYLPGSDNQHLSPASILVSTKSLRSSKEKQDLISYALSLRTGDRFEFHGILAKESVGSLKPEVVNVQSFKCLNCAVAENYVEYFLRPDANENIESLRSYSDDSSARSDGESFLNLFTAYWELVKSYL